MIRHAGAGKIPNMKTIISLAYTFRMLRIGRTAVVVNQNHVTFKYREGLSLGPDLC